MKPSTRVTIGVFIFVLAGASIFFLWLDFGSKLSTPPNTQAKITASHGPETSDDQDKTRFPVPVLVDHPNAESSELNDAALVAALKELFGQAVFEQFFNSENVDRDFVITTDHVDRAAMPATEHLPLKAPDSSFIVREDGDQTILDAKNYERYTPYVELLDKTDLSKLLDVYVRFYPLFQKAFRELGHREYFNDRLVDEIDSVLRAPEFADKSVVLIRPGGHGNYLFADDELEQLPGSQKLLLRMGLKNSKAFKKTLRSIRKLLVNLKRV